MSVGTPVKAWRATAHNGSAVAAGGRVTVTLVVSEWELQIPAAARCNSATLDSGVFVYPSSDGGSTYPTSPLMTVAIPNFGNHSTLQSAVVRLTTGWYAIEYRCSSPTCTFQQLTAEAIEKVNIA